MQGFKQWCEKCQETKGLHNVCHQQPEKEECCDWRTKDECPRHKPHPEPSREWEERKFDESEIRRILMRNFDNNKYLWSKAHQELKDYIENLILSERTALVEEIEKMKKEHKSVDMASKYYHEKEGYNQAVKEVKALKQSLLNT